MKSSTKKRKFLVVQQRPYLFSIGLLLLLFLVIGISMNILVGHYHLPQTRAIFYGGLVLSMILIGIVTKLKWWKRIGFRALKTGKSLFIYWPLLLFVILQFVLNLQNEVAWHGIYDFLALAGLALVVGFNEEVIFRGLMLQSLLKKGYIKAIVITSILFSLSHLGSILAGGGIISTIVQIGFALSIGFCFAVLALKNKLIWPLILIHGLIDFSGLLNQSDKVVSNGMNTAEILVSAGYITLFLGYGLFLLRKMNGIASQARHKNITEKK